MIYWKISIRTNGRYWCAENKYVQSVLLNGKTLKAPKISYADIMAGGELRFIMRKAKNEN
jgi:putative alpha-1,2-mannosidase